MVSFALIRSIIMKKLVSILMIITLCASLSSCFLLDSLDTLYGEQQSGGTQQAAPGNTNINIEEVKDYGNITINSQEPQSLLAAGKALLSAVSITAAFQTTTTTSGWPWGSQTNTETKDYYAMGSGVIYELDKKNGNAYVITNYHVVYDSDSNTQNKISNNISLFLYGQEYADYAIPATYVGGSMTYDIAVLKVEKSAVLMQSNAIAADFADSNTVSVLETAIAVGNPEGDGISATVGCVNVDSEYIDMTGADEKTAISLRVIRTDAAVNEGNSGGGLFNINGEIIGIVNAKITDTTVDNIGYAIPSNIAKYVADNIIDFCDGTQLEKLQKCTLGITVKIDEAYTLFDTDTGKVRRMEKIKVNEVSAGSAATDVLAAGDIISSIVIGSTEYEVSRLFHVTDSMLNARPGEKITFKITRDGKKMEVSLTATEQMLTETA